MQRYKVIILHNEYVLLMRYFESNDLYKNLSFYCVFRRKVRILRMKKIMILEIAICLISVTNKLSRKSLRYK